MRFSLALGLFSGLSASLAGFAQAPPRQSVGERLAADLTWTQAQRDERFQRMETLFPSHVVHRGGRVRLLAEGAPLLPEEAVASLMQTEHLAGALILVDGKVRNEQYGLGLTRAGHWTGFSVTKAVTDTLVGVALRAGAVRSLDDSVAAYLQEMRGSAYDGVSVRQLMTMTSGVRWNENYTSPNADNVRLYTSAAPPGVNSTVAYMRMLPRESPPGTRWRYNTGETDLLGVLLQRATGRSLADQLSAALWQRAGMEEDGSWIASDTGRAGHEFGGSGLSATLRDFGRFGLWVLRGGDGRVPAGWFAEAAKPEAKAGDAAYGYGWWPQADGSFAALGIFGQSILIDPRRKMVIVMLGDWDAATSKEHSRARAAFWAAAKTAVNREAAHASGARRGATAAAH